MSRALTTLILAILLLAPAAARADAPVLRVGTHPVEPFIVKGPDGSWSGISIDLWRLVAERMGVRYEVRELPVEELFAAAERGALDVVVSVNISAKRERTLDLTHAFYSTGLAIAVAPRAETGVLATLGRVLSSRFLQVVLGLLVLLVGVGLLIWLAERRRNPLHFGGHPVRGIGAGFWWSAVTMTTVGYGDKAPVTLVGRLLALLWMFGGVILISIFTAAISSALTVSQLASPVSGPDDLPGARVATVERSGGVRYLDRRGVAYRAFSDAGGALDALAAGEVDAVVYEAPILRYQVRRRPADGLAVLAGTFDNHGYGFALPAGSPIREQVNGALLEVVESDAWPRVLSSYLGASAE